MKPDSILTAARCLAEVSGVPWPEVQRVYRDLQADRDAEAWLPKSRGRTIWAAHPNFIARLLIAMAGSSREFSPREIVAQFSPATRVFPDGETTDETLEWALANALSVPSVAKTVEVFVIQPDNGRAFISHIGADNPAEYRAAGYKTLGERRASATERLVGSRGYVHGDLFRALCDAVAWSRPGMPPTREGEPETDDESPEPKAL